MAPTIEVVRRDAGAPADPVDGAQWFAQYCHEAAVRSLARPADACLSEEPALAVVVPITAHQLLAIQMLGAHGAIRPSGPERTGAIVLTIITSESVIEHTVEADGYYETQTRALAPNTITTRSAGAAS